MQDAIFAVRAFNRFYTRLIGALDARFLGLDISLPEARLLFEIAQGEAPVAQDLQAALDRWSRSSGTAAAGGQQPPGQLARLRDRHGATLLHAAAGAGAESVVRFLLKVDVTQARRRPLPAGGNFVRRRCLPPPARDLICLTPGVAAPPP